MKVVQIAPSDTYHLRRLVLRENRPDAMVAYAGDEPAGAFHLGVVDDGGAGPPLCVASFSPEPTSLRPGRRAFRLRGMATDPARQGRGLGRLVMTDALAHLRGRGSEVLWANARDGALGFYEGLGMEVVGESFMTEIGIPHHLVVLDL